MTENVFGEAAEPHSELLHSRQRESAEDFQLLLEISEEVLQTWVRIRKKHEEGFTCKAAALRKKNTQRAIIITFCAG